MTEPKKISLAKPQMDPHPLRFAITGVTDTLANLKPFVAGLDCDDGLKTFIGAELEKLKTNAASIHLHDVSREDGGFDLHLCITGVNLGVQAGSVIKPGAELTISEK